VGEKRKLSFRYKQVKITKGCFGGGDAFDIGPCNNSGLFVL
jgi:hypothetical protein